MGTRDLEELNEKPVSTRPPAKVLFLESGTGSGGTIRYLCDFAANVDRSRVSLTAGFYAPNSSRWLATLGELKVPVVTFGEPRLSWQAGRFTRVFDGPLKVLRPLRTVARLGKRALTVQIPVVWRLRRFIQGAGIQVVVLNNDVSRHPEGVLAARLARVPCVCRTAGGIGEGLRLKRILNRWVDLFVSVSEATDADQRATPGTKRVVKVHEGVDLGRYVSLPPRREIRRQFGVPDGQKIVVSVSRIEEGKGHAEFVRMAAEVLPRYRDVVFVIVGGSDSEDQVLLGKLKALARELGVEKEVIFAGWREDVAAIMTASDVFVHCPTTVIEGMGLVCLEAMAAGIPAVISENGGLPDTTLPGETGFIVSKGDVETMASRVLDLLNDEDLARRFGRRARRRIEETFDIARNAPALLDLVLEYVPAAAGR